MLMKKADIYVFASNRHEGWGAVLNEAMAEGCAVIANESAGSTHELIQHGKNGLIFKDGSVEDLFGCLELYIKDASLRRSLGYRAWRDMYEIWSPKIGASRLIHLIEGINNNANLPCFLSGLCSPCDTTKDTI
jgi:glycosyltransferase involved in cell wall biosynthesis